MADMIGRNSCFKIVIQSDDLKENGLNCEYKYNLETSFDQAMIRRRQISLK